MNRFRFHFLFRFVVRFSGFGVQLLQKCLQAVFTFGNNDCLSQKINPSGALYKSCCKSNASSRCSSKTSKLKPSLEPVKTRSRFEFGQRSLPVCWRGFWNFYWRRSSTFLLWGCFWSGISLSIVTCDNGSFNCSPYRQNRSVFNRNLLFRIAGFQQGTAFEKSDKIESVERA